VRFEVPKPRGARPRSVALPCASQARPLPGRCAELFPAAPFIGRFVSERAEGGRFCAIWRCRAVISELAPEFACALPGRFSNWPLVFMLPCTPELPTWPFAPAAPFACGFPNRPAVVAPFIVRTG